MNTNMHQEKEADSLAMLSSIYHHHHQAEKQSGFMNMETKWQTTTQR